jgi:hypothetical protein
VNRLWQQVRTHGDQPRTDLSDHATLIKADALSWLQHLPPCSIHAVVTDPPYGLIEYAARDHRKLRAGRGGVWRIPPQFDGAKRRPLPRFTVLSPAERAGLSEFFTDLGLVLYRALVPGAHVFVASNPLLSPSMPCSRRAWKSAARWCAWCRPCAVAIGPRARKSHLLVSR